MRSVKIDSWNFVYAHHADAPVLKTVSDIKKSGLDIIPASVPGNFELDLSRAGVLPRDLYFGTNILEVQKYEDVHLWYFAEFTLEKTDEDTFLLFEGIDTASEIYVDGILFGKTENMLIPYEFPTDGLEAGTHTLVVHIIPASVYSQKYPLPVKCKSQFYNFDSLAIRKAPYMYGWDIMPRTVSAGIWRPVSVIYKPKKRIEECAYSIRKVTDDTATLNFRMFINSCDLKGLTVRIEGRCGASAFCSEAAVYSNNFKTEVSFNDPLLWWPRNYGEPNLYETTVSLLCNGEVCDSTFFNLGICHIELERTSLAGPDGKFCFRVNGKRIFVMGTNWVPTDAFPSRHAQFDKRALEMASELGCNMIRCWGGNVYPNDEFYNYCDTHGILVWQDFAMACGTYPNDERFCALIRNEAETVVRALRNHPCIALWSGDNECDISLDWNASKFNGEKINRYDPNKNKLTRNIIPDVLDQHDLLCRPYLPSSPYIDETAFKGGRPSEDHMWGPRDWFKGEFYYKNSVCHFASETGYHGCPSPESLAKFISADSLCDFGDGTVCNNVQWLAHATCPVPTPADPYAYRIPLMTRQVERLFGSSSRDINEYSYQSQISQAEALKFFIEHFRVQKWYRTGILWWNLIDGWPQISDAVVDYYGDKKLAYGYIKRSQQPFCIMCDEPDDRGVINVCASNDTRNTVNISYTVTNVQSGEVKASGGAEVLSDETAVIGSFRENKTEYLVIEWTGDESGKNHFVTSLGDGIKLSDYKEFIKKARF